MANRFLEKAIELAMENVHSGRGGPFGAVIVRAGVVIAEAANMVTATNDPTAHAEIVAIRSACASLHTFDLHGCEIYASCEPCPMCLGAIYWARLDRVYFAATSADAAAAGFDDSRFYDEIRAVSQHRSLPIARIAAEHASAPFDAWRAHLLKTEY
jgi:guanine deaminase